MGVFKHGSKSELTERSGIPPASEPGIGLLPQRREISAAQGKPRNLLAREDAGNVPRILNQLVFRHNSKL